MKAIILAAGRGSRLGNYTKELPKALVDINGKSLIQRQIDLLRKNDIRKIIVITGFNPEKFNLENVSYIEDVNFDKHEQLGSLIAASSELSEDVLVIFGDILFHEKIIKQILSSDDDIAIPIDLNWTKSYEKYDNVFKLKYGIKLNKTGLRKSSINEIDSYRKASIFWTRNPKLVNPMKEKRIWVQVAKNFKPIIRLTEEEVREEFFDFDEKIMIEAKKLGSGKHHISADAHASWQKHDFVEKGEAKSDGEEIEIIIN